MSFWKHGNDRNGNESRQRLAETKTMPLSPCAVAASASVPQRNSAMAKMNGISFNSTMVKYDLALFVLFVVWLLVCFFVVQENSAKALGAT